MTEPRRRNPAETRKRILMAAVNEFSAHGFSGGRIDRIATAARANTRMIYHYFGDKAGLYVAVLEHVLGELRREELNIDVAAVPPYEGLLQLFDFTYDHFERHPKLVKLLSGENLIDAAYLKRSQATPVISSPVLDLIANLLRRGAANGTVAAGIDPLQLYVLFVGLSYFHLSNGPTLSVIFSQDLKRPSWRRTHRRMAREMLAAYLLPDAENLGDAAAE